MHSWIFRNRDRLRLVYGALRSPEGLLEDGAVDSEPDSPLPTVIAEALPNARSGGLLGTVERLDDDILLTPMPKMAG